MGCSSVRVGAYRRQEYHFLRRAPTSQSFCGDPLLPDQWPVLLLLPATEPALGCQQRIEVPSRLYIPLPFRRASATSFFGDLSKLREDQNRRRIASFLEGPAACSESDDAAIRLFGAAAIRPAPGGPARELRASPRPHSLPSRCRFLHPAMGNRSRHAPGRGDSPGQSRLEPAGHVMIWSSRLSRNPTRSSQSPPCPRALRSPTAACPDRSIAIHCRCRE